MKTVKDSGNEVKNFFSWFLSSSELKEKVVSSVILVIEILLLIHHSAEDKTVLLIYALNFIFLIYFLIDLKKHFKLEFQIKNPERILQLKQLIDDNHKLLKLQARANESIKQFRSFGGFLSTTAILYFILFAAKVESSVNDSFSSSSGYHELHVYISYFFSLFLHLFSYLGVFYILKCFYVLSFPTFDKLDESDGNLNGKTDVYIFFIAGILLLEMILSFPSGEEYQRYSFYFEFICGVINAFTMTLLFARFESRLLGINSFIIIFLYIYSTMQTSLPLITGTFFGSTGKSENDFIDVSFFNTLILSICLLGKIILYNIIVYLYRTKRLFYYFIFTFLNYEKRIEYWAEFDANSTLD